MLLECPNRMAITSSHQRPWERVAQPVEHVTFNHGVLGSSPSALTTTDQLNTCAHHAHAGRVRWPRRHRRRPVRRHLLKRAGETARWCRSERTASLSTRPPIQWWPTKEMETASATSRTRLDRHDFVHVCWIRTTVLNLHHLFEFQSLYREFICQPFEEFALLRVARSPAHKDQIRGIGTEFVQLLPEVRHVVGLRRDPPRPR